MAKLIVMGPWIGPGEEHTARVLAESLPDDWLIIAGRKLPGQDRSDVDFIVIADNLVFVIEEKHWGPTVVAGDARWSVNGREYRSPVDSVAHKSRQVAGLVSDRIKIYRERVASSRPVCPIVILSHPDLRLVAGRHADLTEHVFALQDAPAELQKLDETRDTKLRLARDQVAQLLADIDPREARIRRLGDYLVTSRLPSLGRAICFTAEHFDTGERVILRCYPLDGWGEDDPGTFIRREVRALTELAADNRTWRYHPPQTDDERRWYIVPVIPPRDGRTLAASIERNDPGRIDGQLPDQVSLSVAMDAFDALTAVHARGLTHRILTPSRIWLGPGMRVLFSDFYVARIEGHQTVALWADDEPSQPFRAPECQTSLVLAGRMSDVYALALSLTAWLAGQNSITLGEACEWLAGRGALAEILTSCLSELPDQRPSAAEAAALLFDLRQSTHANAVAAADAPGRLEPDVVVAQRYLVDRQLGVGGVASTWVAYDQKVGMRVVLKQLHTEQAPQTAHDEFNRARAIKVPGCARVWDIIDSTTPSCLVYEYIDGQSLDDRVRLEPIGVDNARRVILEVLKILTHLHDQAFVHGDLSPGNIIVDEEWRPSLIDFGLSQIVGAKPLGGTVATMAPELFRGRAANAQSDIYSAACTLLQCMLGRAPYAGDPSHGVDRDSTPRPLTDDERKQWGSDGIALIEAVYAGVSPDPNDRPSTAAEFAEIVHQARPPADISPNGTKRAINPTVDALRRLYRGSSLGNAGNRGLDDEFALATYIPTLLDQKLLPAIISGALGVVLLTGNPGDGKTSFLVKISAALLAAGGTETGRDDAGWRISHNGRTYAAVYDASESHGTLTSDQLVKSALEAPSDAPHTALLAVNDGRLLQFFTDHAHEYPDIEREVRRRLDGRLSQSTDIAIVDLKTRTLADLQGEGLAMRISDAFTAEHFWTACNDCVASAGCPILRNALDLRETARPGVGELVLTSHLRGHRRATFRDVRSALAWLITGDHSCEDVHQARESHRDLSRSAAALLPDLAFSDTSGDYLISEWSQLDPGRVASPTIERRAREKAIDAETVDEERITTLLRRTYFGFEPGSTHRAEVRSYRYLDEFERMLTEPDERSRDRILVGLSRIAGAFGHTMVGLAVGERQPKGGWAVLKTLPSSEFRLHTRTPEHTFVEAVPDSLTLTHDSGANLRLALDTAELVLRAADGEVLADADSDAVVQEVESFASKLKRQRARSAQIIDPAGFRTDVRIDGTTIQKVRVP